MSSGFQEEKLPDKLNLSVWLKIGKYAFRKWPLVLILLILTIIVTFYDSSFVPTMNAAAIQAARDYSGAILDFNDLYLEATIIFGIRVKLNYWGFLFLQLGMIALRSVAIFFNFYLTNLLSVDIVTSLRRDTFRKVQELPFSYFDKTSSGWLIARMQNDTSSIGDILSWNLCSLLWCVFDFLFAFITMFSINWKLSLIVCLSIPLMAILIPIIEKKLLERHREARHEYSSFVGWLSESIAGAKTIKTLSMEERVQEEAGTILSSIKRKRLRAERVNAFFEPILSFCSSLMIALLLVMGFYFSSFIGVEEAALASTLVLFIGFTQNIYSPLQDLSATFSEFMAVQAGAEKVMQLLSSESDILDSSEVIDKYGTILNPKEENYEPIKGDIVYQDIHFSYQKGPEVLHGLNLRIKEGQSLAVVGETGSGKSTLVNLLCRFYEPTSGKIVLGEKDYHEYSLGYLRSKIGYVQQNPFVFSSSFKDNIAYGSAKTSLEDIKKAAKIVGIDDYIMMQKDGYDTVLKEGGDSLSQGQKQLISFARALVRNPEILILDEATSSIDTETEKEVQKALLEILKGRTSIIIAHRLSTIVDCDKIILLDKGMILEEGSHKELMEKKGAYYSLYMDQFKDLSIDSQLDTYQNQIANKGIKI